MLLRPRAPTETPPCREGSSAGLRSCLVLNEAMVVPHQPEEGMNRMHRSWWCPVQHRLDLLLVHGHASHRDDVAEVGDLPAAKCALLLFDKEVLLMQGGEDSADVE
jgi:hypothetical protein